VWARLGGREYTLEIERATGHAAFSDGGLRLRIDHPHRRVLRVEVLAEAPEGHGLDVEAYLATALAVDGVLDASRANPVNCALAGPAAAETGAAPGPDTRAALRRRWANLIRRVYFAGELAWPLARRRP
jgi:hypothetical protein